MTTYPVRTRRWTRAEYDRLIDAGVFADEPIELVGGELIVAEPKGTAHQTAIGLMQDALEAQLGAGWLVRSQAPVALDDESEPEPDVLVVPGSHRDYSRSHPARPVLVVEVAESTLRSDRARKGSLYARAGLADYWIVNLVDRVIEVYRNPVVDEAAWFGWRYATRDVIAPGGSITLLAAPHASVAVVDVLP